MCAKPFCRQLQKFNQPELFYPRLPPKGYITTIPFSTLWFLCTLMVGLKHKYWARMKKLQGECTPEHLTKQWIKKEHLSSHWNGLAYRDIEILIIYSKTSGIDPI